jgi:phytoene synthase
MANGPETADLPVAQRLALSYAPARHRTAWAGFFALDARLATLVRSAREPMVAQIRLAWWREQLSGLGSTARTDEPLLAELAALDRGGAALAQLVDGWEAMLLDDSEAGAAAEQLAEARTLALFGLFEAHSVEAPLRRAVMAWSLGEYRPPESASHPDPGLQAGLTLPRYLRPVQLLGCLGRRAALEGRSELLASPLDLLFAMRIGLIGR